MKGKPSIKSVVLSFAADIENGHLAANTKLPSLSELASRQNISKSSAVEIYERLVAADLIEVRGNRGFFVKECSSTASMPDASQTAIATPLHREIAAQPPTRLLP